MAFGEISTDHGIEFLSYKVLERSALRVQRYFRVYCDPAHFYKGRAARKCKFIHSIILKGININALTQCYITFIANQVNCYPPSSFGGRISFVLLAKKGPKCFLISAV